MSCNIQLWVILIADLKSIIVELIVLLKIFSEKEIIDLVNINDKNCKLIDLKSSCSEWTLW